MTEERIKLSLDLLRDGDKLLDIGCGNGLFGNMILVNQKYSDVYGIDIDRDILYNAKANGINVIIADLNKNLPIKNISFDTIVCLEVIEHVIDPNNLLININRILRPGGRLIISTPNVQWIYHILRLCLGNSPKTSFGDTENFDGGHLHYFTFMELESILKLYNFKIEKKIGVYDVRYDLIKRILKLFGIMSRNIFSSGIIISCKKSEKII